MDAEPQPDAFPTWDETTLAELSAFGVERAVAAGERVAAAIGEGSSAVRSVHEHLGRT